MRRYADGGCVKDHLIATRDRPHYKGCTREQGAGCRRQFAVVRFEVSDDVKAIILRIARSEMSTDEVEAWEKQQGTEWSNEGDGK
ncbi:hypothetical protein [Sinorhizobium americanum]|uniref:Uncharacterized protein n=1 Tax=Sinorhizobium americanum TaxID=194963 RepID=A0A4R2BTL3_9HYPH|nr:hypothetical protein [Sinorhizobium americanum]TCN30162.1 hypothetical protein EV184_10833 [Sinorhizobium americanum]